MLPRVHGPLRALRLFSDRGAISFPGIGYDDPAENDFGVAMGNGKLAGGNGHTRDISLGLCRLCHTGHSEYSNTPCDRDKPSSEIPKIRIVLPVVLRCQSVIDKTIHPQGDMEVLRTI
jgi:hypothetical protein